MLRLGRSAICAASLLIVWGCAAAAGERPPGAGTTVDPRDLVVTTANGEVCVASSVVPAPCVPVVDSDEPVVSAALTRLDPTADVVMVLARSDVVVAGLGLDAVRVPIPPGGRDLSVWLGTVHGGTPVICASFRAPDGEGRLIVHRALTVATAEVPALDPEPDDAC